MIGTDEPGGGTSAFAVELGRTGPIDRPFEFRGTGLEYFRVWIVNLLLTIATIGLYSPWAKVRRNRYLYGNTLVDRHNFDYVADPVKILKGRLLAVFIVALYYLGSNFLPGLTVFLLGALILLVPFVLVTSTAFRLRNSTYRNIRFLFRGRFVQAYLVFAVPLLIALAAAWLVWSGLDATGALDRLVELSREDGDDLRKEDLLLSFYFFVILPVIPWLDFARVRFVAANSQWGALRARFGKGAWSFYWVYLRTLVVFLVSIVAGTFLGMALFAREYLDGPDDADLPLLVVIPTVAVLYLVVGTLAGAYFRARRTNLVYDNLHFGDTRVRSRLHARGVAWLYLSNTIAIAASLGLLIPWAKIRMLRYVADHTLLEAQDLDAVAAAAQADASAFGQELGEFFDLDIGL